MRIAVLVKEVPDTYGDRAIVLETGLIDRESSTRVLDEIGERAVEAALRVRDTATDSSVVVISMGPSSAQDVLRKALAMGADEAVHIVDDRLVGADLALTAATLAEAVRRQSPDLVVTGNLSTDGGGGVMGALLAEHLGFAQATYLRTVSVHGAILVGERTTDAGTAVIEADLPVVVSITEAAPEARFPNFKGIMAAKKKPVVTCNAADLGIDPEDFSVPRSIVIAAAEREARAGGVKIVDEGDAGARLAEYLIAQGMA